MVPFYLVSFRIKVSFIFQVTVKTDDMDLAGDIIQALASFLGIEVDMAQTISCT